MPTQAQMRERITSNIAVSGFHTTLVQGGPLPRFAYSIGLRDRIGAELVLAGASLLTKEQVAMVMRSIAAAAESRGDPSALPRYVVPGVGSFLLEPSHRSWTQRLLLGATDYYSGEVEALQIVPEGALRTIDVPNMSGNWAADAEPIWKWLELPWDLPIRADSVAVTNAEALHGRPVSEAARWEEIEWEVFAGAGPDVAPDDIRIVPLATLLAFDPSVFPVAGLAVGEAARRDPPGEWQPWIAGQS